MPSRRYVLGLNLTRTRDGIALDDGAAVVLDDGAAAVAIAQERLTRRKHAGGVADAVHYCLTAQGLDLDQVDLVAVSSCCDMPPDPGFALDLLGSEGLPVRKEHLRVVPSHHLSHAASAYYPSGFTEAIVIVADNGEIIGWFEGGSEYGLRGLGRRSVLGDPRTRDTKTRLDMVIKRREPFRPYAPSVLEEEASAWFAFDGDFQRTARQPMSCMFVAPQVRPERRSQVPAVTFTGITAARETEYYDLFTEWREDTDFFVTVAKQHGGPVLEVGCGTGRVTKNIAAAGIGIDGFDSSPERLGIAREALPAESGVKLYCQDMRAFSLPGSYQLVMLPYRVLQELATTAEKIQCLSCVRDHLEEGGLVLIDNYNPSIPMLARDPATSARVMEKTTPGGEIIRRTDRVVSRDYLSQTQQLEVIYDVRHADGRTEHYVIPYETSYMFRFELEHLLARCGFTIREIWGGFDFEPFGQGASDELIVLAERAAGALQPAVEAALVVFSLPRRAPWATLAGPLSGTPRDLPCRRERRTTLAEGRHFREDRQQPSPRYQGPAPRQRRGQGPCAGVDHHGVPAIRIPAH